nr:ParB/RepB/Spo0J family partition protein [Veillonella montpellierensis]
MPTSKKNGGLGRGIGSLMNLDNTKTIDEIQQSNKSELPIEVIVPNENQPRKNFSEDGLATLVESIKQYGIVQPIVVRKLGDTYQIVAGERRYRAAIQVGLTTVPVIIKNYSTEEVTEIALVENLQRQDLDPIEEAYAYQRLMETFKQTQEKIAVKLGRSRSHVANMMRLLQLPEPIRNDLSVADLTIGQARPLLGLKDEALQLEAVEKIKEGELSARQVEALVKALVKPKQVKQDTARSSSNDSAEIRALVEQLKVSLGTPVAIKLHTGKTMKGRIEISFSSERELERLLSYMQTRDESDTHIDSFRV